MPERNSYNLFCFCMYYKSDFEFYGFKGLKLDFDKVWEFLVLHKFMLKTSRINLLTFN